MGSQPKSIEQMGSWCLGLADMLAEKSPENRPWRLAEAIKGLADADCASLYIFRKNKAPEAIFEQSGLSTPLSYAESAYLLDPVHARFQESTLPSSCNIKSLLPEKYTRSRYWQDYYQHLNLAAEHCFNISVDTATVLHFRVGRSRPNPGYSPFHAALFQAIQPVVAEVLTEYWLDRTNSRINGAETGAETILQHSLDKFGSSILTSREQEVMQQILLGHSDKSTASRLNITPGTVRNHKKNIFSKLQVSSQGQIFRLFLDSLGASSNGSGFDDPLAEYWNRHS